jgi:hypothetical protein
MSREETVASVEEYRRWLFTKLLSDKECIKEFNRILDIVIQEGEVVLQCSCTNSKFCHGTIIKNALRWAEGCGLDGWQTALKEVTSRLK